MAAKKNKEPGRIAQIFQVYNMTRRYDPTVTLWIILSIVGPIALALVLAYVFTPDNLLSIILFGVVGLLAGVLIAMIVLGRKAESTAYKQIEGQPGAVSAIMKSALKRGWIGNENPVVVNGKTKDAVYRAVGRGGVVLIAEGPKSRTQRLADDEKRKVGKVVPNVAVTIIFVGPDPDSIPLAKISWRMAKIRATLTKREVMVVNNRLSSVHNALPIPKGIDPYKVRAGRPR